MRGSIWEVVDEKGANRAIFPLDVQTKSEEENIRRELGGKAWWETNCYVTPLLWELMLEHGPQYI